MTTIFLRGMLLLQVSREVGRGEGISSSKDKEEGNGKEEVYWREEKDCGTDGPWFHASKTNCAIHPTEAYEDGGQCIVEGSSGYKSQFQ